MKRTVGLAIGLLLQGVSWGYADDDGLAQGAAAYLGFSLGARATAMGQAQAAVRPLEASGLHANPATLSLLTSQSFTTTTGMLGLDRSLYFVGYALPFRKSEEEDPELTSMMAAELGPEYRQAAARPVHQQMTGPSDPASSPDMALEMLAEIQTTEPRRSPSGRGWSRWFVPTKKIEMAVATGFTSFGIQNIEGRSEYGALEADFQNAERAIYLSYASRLYQNLGIGLTGKYLGQTLQSASANGFSFDVGTWYGMPFISRGSLDLALVARDLGGSLKWKVSDPVLDSEFEYKEPVRAKYTLGTAYTSPGQRWLWSMDIMKVQKQDPRLYAGLEFKALHHLKLRAGENGYNPTAGFGLDWGFRFAELLIDYAFQYDLNALVNPHWLTLTIRFLPVKAS